VPANRYSQVQQWLQDGKTELSDLSVSRPRRRQPWGIPVPGDDDHTMYVWVDALANYLTATGFPRLWNFDSLETAESYAFPPEVHVIGKDILRYVENVCLIEMSLWIHRHRKTGKASMQFTGLLF
jgi:methionyl-tRNA synthetase